MDFIQHNNLWWGAAGAPPYFYVVVNKTRNYFCSAHHNFSHTLIQKKMLLISVGNLSQILQHTKGECRFGRCLIALSFDNQQTFEIFREHSSTVSTIKRYLQVHAVDLQFYVPTRRDDDGLYLL